MCFSKAFKTQDNTLLLSFPFTSALFGGERVVFELYCLVAQQCSIALILQVTAEDIRQIPYSQEKSPRSHNSLRNLVYNPVLLKPELLLLLQIHTDSKFAFKSVELWKYNDYPNQP